MELTYKITIYATANGKAPFIEWLESLDRPLRARVKERLDRIALGNLGDHKIIKADLHEFRLSFGSGYRIYYVKEQDSIILLLCGGNKATQKKDIKKAFIYWHDYLMR